MTGPSNNHQSTQIGAQVQHGGGQTTKTVISFAGDSSARAKKPGRQPGATPERIGKIKLLIDELKAHPMTPAEMGHLLQYSPSGVRKYIADLRAADLLVVCDNLTEAGGQAAYALCDDQARVQEYLKRLSTTQQGAMLRVKPSNLAIALADTTRHFHVLADDTHYSLRISRAPVAADPLALPKNFFVGGVEHNEPLLERRSAPRAPLPMPRFPSPESIGFVLEVAL